jgi:CPA2 family monovalent cation:H+ antiporter-2
MDSWVLLLEIVLLLLACLILGGIASRLGQSILVGYLLAGMLLGGPGSLGIVRSEGDIETIAELGVALLLFSLGLEFSWPTLKQLGRRALAAGVLQVLLTALLFSVVSLLAGYQPRVAVCIGAIVSLSSTAAVLRVLTDLGESDSPHGRTSIAILLLQDVAVVPLAIFMLLMRGGQDPSQVAWEGGRVLVWSAVFVLALYLVLRVAASLLRTMALERNRELTVLLAVAVGLGATWAAHAAGLSPALGAFVAGMFLGASAFATQIRSDVSSLKVVLLTLFFASVGMVADPLWIAQNLPLVVTASVVLIAGKIVLITAILRIMGWPPSVSLATGLTLSQVGEFAFVLGAVGTEYGLISQDIYTLLVSVAITTLFVTPYLVSVAPRLGRWLELRLGGLPAGIKGEPFLEPPDVVIVGFGPAGQAVGRALSGSCDGVLVIDLNHEAKALAEAMGFSCEIGDAQQLGVLEHALVHRAKVAVLTLPSRVAALTVLEQIRAMAPEVCVVVRSRYHRHKSDFENAGALAVVDEEEEVGSALSRSVMSIIKDSG